MNKNNFMIERDQLSFTLSRVFDAPRELVWKVTTDPELIPRWWGPRNYTTRVDQHDFQVGGSWRYAHLDEEGNEYVFYGIFKEITPPKRLVYTFEYEPYAGHGSLETITFEALPGGKTRITSRNTFERIEDLEGMIQSGMEGGAVDTWDRLEEVLAGAQQEV